MQFQVQAHHLPQTARGFREELPARHESLRDDLRRGARCRGANIGDEIADGEINLVSHGGNHRQLRLEDRARHRLLVERPQILQAPAAARHENQVKPFLGRQRRAPFVEQADGSRDLPRRAVALHAGRREDDLQARRASLDDMQHIADRRARRRGDEAQSSWIAGQRTLARAVEETLALQLALEFLEGDLQRTNALRLDGAHQQLILAAHFVNRQLAVEQQLLPVLEKFAVRRRLAAKEHAAQLRRRILEREINVARRLRAQVRHLAADPHRRDLLLQHAPDLRRQFAHGQHDPRLLRREQLAEIPL